MAVEINSGASRDGKIVALIFQTIEGVPIEVAMSPEIARETVGLLSTELLRIVTRQHTKLSQQSPDRTLVLCAQVDTARGAFEAARRAYPSTCSLDHHRVQIRLNFETN
jgi:hypothetical protein